ncbi:YihY/virulence factor BrkB family protein [Parasphingopyxis lamellibrachiae]|uniref:Membrane protein n=1 Tax=Parasphingopyxis lamellibrachiae TaxID=680125 RepID=A0A3D9FIN1_9SPHN|nr:YihY/virulence factor BrkB family protein [Parasphingopyxis lamellibrachiae]RED17653.1 membrane protein [Parasphingopyxis lamellibrachiae]
MTHEASQSPEARRRLAEVRIREGRPLDYPPPRTWGWTTLKRVADGVYAEGFIHAGNLAFMALLALFPFFIVLAAIAQSLGRTEDGLQAVAIFLQNVPPSVATALEDPIASVLSARTGNLLWIGAAIGLWTTASFIETVREILRRAYGTPYGRPFYEYRLFSIGLIIISVALALLAFALQFVMTGVEQFIYRLVPLLEEYRIFLSLSRLVPAFAIFLGFYLVFWSLTPRQYRARLYPKWPGALLVTIWWLGTTALMPVILENLISYDLTYGSLAGFMLSMMFFFVIGFGVVVAAYLNAALAEVPESELRKHIEETEVEEP